MELDSKVARKLITNQQHKPSLDEIRAYAVSLGITNVPAFWELFDDLHREWAQFRSCESWTEFS